MNRIRCMICIALVLAACEPGPEPASEAPASEFAVQLPCPTPVTVPPATAGFTEFAQYSWSLFIAANWPVTSGQRGVPDCSRSIGAAGATVWESYRTVEQIFLPDAADPGPWDGGDLGMARLNFRSKAPQMLPLESSIQQAVGGWLIDQQSNPTYYQIAVNRTQYDYVRAHHYYNADTLNAARSIVLPDSALEVKGAWRIVQAADSSRYHTMAAEVMTFDSAGQPTGEYRTVTVGLVGLHIVYKAPGFPQWTWATFEHVDNAPDSAVTTGAWSYYNPACTGPYCTPNVSPVRAGIPFGTPNQIVRVSPVRAAIDSVNTAMQAQLVGTPFHYYRLIAPQWPSDPNDPGNPQGTPTPGTVANVALESYVQPTSSCMDCHSTARVPNGSVKTNYSFTFLFAQSPSSGSR